MRQIIFSPFSMRKRDVLKLLEKNGWQIVRGGKGSHTKLKKDGKMVIVPGHNLSSEVKPFLLKEILKQAGIEE